MKQISAGNFTVKCLEHYLHIYWQPPRLCSPVMFSIYVDDMGTNKTNGSVSLIKCADDTLVLEKLNPHDQSPMQEVLTILNRWCDERDLILIETKIKEILFSNARDDSDPPTLTMRDRPLQCITAYKYLSITISNKLKFQRNTKLLVERCEEGTVYDAQAEIPRYIQKNWQTHVTKLSLRVVSCTICQLSTNT